jgi:hypothetical protein
MKNRGTFDVIIYSVIFLLMLSNVGGLVLLHENQIKIEEINIFYII